MYLAKIPNLYNNKIVAYKLYEHQQIPLMIVMIDVLKTNLKTSEYPQGVIIHSDQGNIYTSYTYQNLLEEITFHPNISQLGNCRDTAVIGSFHSNLKTEKFAHVKHHSLTNKEKTCNKLYELL